MEPRHDRADLVHSSLDCSESDATSIDSCTDLVGAEPWTPEASDSAEATVEVLLGRSADVERFVASFGASRSESAGFETIVTRCCGADKRPSELLLCDMM